jgi:threonine synthase
MRYYSTNKNSPLVSFKDATIRGQAPDKGLYFPEKLPLVDTSLIQDIETLSNEEIAFRVIRPYIGEEIPADKLFQIVSETINFPIPLVRVNEEMFSLELFHGPTLAFKDVGARFMSRCLNYFQAEENDMHDIVTVLVATSGDTGGAVANGFYDVKGTEVVILYPSGKVSPVQELQLTTLGKNIHALEVNGSFDDCQRMVKEAFADDEIRNKLFLTSANSINIARWLPQQFYYFLAYKQWPGKDVAPVVSVPSGNFGNICAGILAMQSGLPIKHFIASCNSNDVVSGYLRTEEWIPKKPVQTLSNAMDVGDPSNFIRILEIFNHQFPELADKLSSITVSDEVTISTIREVEEKFDYLLDPHGAVGYEGLKKYLEKNEGMKGIFLETAHPVKFPKAIEEATGKTPGIPASIKTLMDQKKQAHKLSAEYKSLKEYLLS